MRILGLDLGTHCGVAFAEDDLFSVHTEHLASAKEIKEWGEERLTRRQDPRVLRLRDYLLGLPQMDVVVFEDVEFSSYTKQTQLWSSYRTVVWLVFKQPPTVVECVPVATLKKFATGHGGATKEMMETALRRQHPEIFRQKRPLDDNGVDAAWLCLWAKHVFGRYKKYAEPISR